MNVKQMNYIITLEKEGSALLAAKKLGISQSTLSKYLAGLEKALGVSLFGRSQKQLVPTVYGRIYIDAARRILQVYDSACRTISGMKDAGKTRLTIGLPAYCNCDLHVYLLTKFQEKYPNVLLLLKEYDSIQALSLLLDGQLSFALLNLCTEYQASFDYFPVSDSELVLAIPASEYDSILQGSIDGADPDAPILRSVSSLKDMPLIFPSKNKSLRFFIESLFSTWQIDPLIVCESDSPTVRLELVRQNAGSTFILESAIEPDPSITYLRLKERYQLKNNVACLKGRQLTDPEQFCIRLLRQYYKEQSGEHNGY